MIKNIVLKNILIGTVFRGISFLNKGFSKDEHRILLYSDQTFRDNTKYLYDYLIEKGYDKEYFIICACKDYKNYRKDEMSRARFVSPVKGVVEFLFSSHVFYSFGRIPIKPVKNQIVIQMWHGTSFKGFAENQKRTNKMKDQFYTYVYASSDYFVPIVEKKFQVKHSCVTVCGHPRTDILYRKENRYPFEDYDKVILWLPTFRKSRSLGIEDGTMKSLLPVVRNDQLLDLEAFLKTRNTKLIVKLHPEQDTGVDVERGLEYLTIMSDKKFKETQYDLYWLMKQTDALITDYSSVFYDYLLLNRPIGFTDDDMDEYSTRRGFAVDDPDKFRPGMRMHTFKDLVSFLNDVCDGKDTYKEDRVKINDLSNYYQDGRNCERTLALSHISLRIEYGGGGVK